ncbi:hypothetical protein BC834DRAFT_932144 [Gloeopeniophorella convolvens]|nr:hypothetical protein BC834DRAFT_932144 [Gloeopeniophorella convolvens]
MSAPKAKPAANGTKKAKGPAPANGSAVPADVSAKTPTPATSSGKPDKADYDAEQESIRAEIDALQTKLNAVKEKISLVTKGGSGNERRNALRAELDEIRSQQSGNKASRGKIFDQMKALQDGIQKKIKDLQTARGRTQFRSLEEADAHIKNLEKQVDSGSLKLVDEKRALQEINQIKRLRKTIESFKADSDAIDADRAAIDELKKQLDDPEAKAVSERYDTIKAELDEIKKEGDELYANRTKLFDERTALQQQVDALITQRRESAQRFREANDRFYTKLNEDRARRAERARAQRESEEQEKRMARATQLREEASQPAYQVQIEDCQTLIDFFSGKSTTAVVSTAKADPAEPKLDIRKVEAPENLVARKKKGEDEESYFVGGKGKGKGKKGPKANGAAAGAAAAGTEATSSSSTVNVSFGTLTALLALSIPPPSSQADVPRVVEDLKMKKAWFEANQARVTAEAIAKAEAEIKRLMAKGDAAASDNATVPNGSGENPPEPAPTPEVADTLSVDPPSEAVADKLEAVEETEAS